MPCETISSKAKTRMRKKLEFPSGLTGEDHITTVLGSAQFTRSCLKMDRTFPSVRRTVAYALNGKRAKFQKRPVMS